LKRSRNEKPKKWDSEKKEPVERRKVMGKSPVDRGEGARENENVSWAQKKKRIKN